MKRFQLYKVVRNGRLMHIASIIAENRIEAMKLVKKDYGRNIAFGFKFWNYYVTGLIR